MPPSGVNHCETLTAADSEMSRTCCREKVERCLVGGR